MQILGLASRVTPKYTNMLVSPTQNFGVGGRYFALQWNIDYNVWGDAKF